MSRDDHQPAGTPAEREALEALRQLPPPAAPAALRLRARAAFLGMDAPRTRAPRRAIVARLLLAAAAIAAVVFGTLPAGRWTVTDVKMPQDARLGNRPPAVGMTTGATAVVTEPSAEVEVQLESDIRLRVLGDSEVRLPDGPGRWWRRSLALHLEAGEVYGTTGGERLPYTFRLKTPEAEAVLTGTTFAVFRTGDATCFCLYAGALQIRDRVGKRDVDLPVGRRVFIYRDGREPSIQPLDAPEQMKLQMMDDQGMPPRP